MISLITDTFDQQIAGTYPAYVGKNYGAVKKSPTFLSITQNRSNTLESSANPVDNFGDYSVLANSISVKMPVTVMILPASRGEAGAVNGTRNICSNTSTHIAVTQGSTLLSRYRIFYSTKRENKCGLPSKHVLVAQGSMTSNSRFFKEIFGSTIEIEIVFDRAALTPFLEHIRKNFRKCEILRCLSRKCPIKASKPDEERQPISKDIEEDKTVSEIPKNGTDLGDESNPQSQSHSILEKLDIDENHDSSSIVNIKRQNRKEEGEEEVEPLTGQAILNQKIKINVENIDQKILYKKTKRGCRGGKKSHDQNSSYYHYQCSKRKKQKFRSSSLVHLGENSTDKTPEKIVSFAEEITNTKYEKSAIVAEIGVEKEMQMEEKEEGAAQKETVSKNTRSQSPRVTGTVSDRLLARMQRNILQDITFPRKIDRTVTDLSREETPDHSIFFGGYISQEEGIRRSHRLRQTDTPQTNREKRKTSSTKRKQRVIDSNIKNNFIGSKDPALVKRIRFRYNSDTADSEDEDSDHTTSRLCYSEFLGLNSPKIGDPPVPMKSDIEVHVRSDSEEVVRSDSDINCTDATESISSAQWLEAMTMTSSKAMKSGLSHHVNFRTLITEVKTPASMIACIRTQQCPITWQYIVSIMSH